MNKWAERYHLLKGAREMQERFEELHLQVRVRAMIEECQVTAADDERIEAYVKQLVKEANARKRARKARRKGTVNKLVAATKQV